MACSCTCTLLYAYIHTYLYCTCTCIPSYTCTWHMHIHTVHVHMHCTCSIPLSNYIVSVHSAVGPKGVVDLILSCYWCLFKSVISQTKISYWLIVLWVSVQSLCALAIEIQYTSSVVKRYNKLMWLSITVSDNKMHNKNYHCLPFTITKTHPHSRPRYGTFNLVRPKSPIFCHTRTISLRRDAQLPNFLHVNITTFMVLLF